MKTLLLALALWSIQWPVRTESLAGVYCPSQEAVRIVSHTYIAYSLGRNLDRAGCAFLVLDGLVIGESQPFGISDTLYSFETVISQGHTVYRLREIGEGYET